MHNPYVIIIDDDVELCTSLNYLLASVNIAAKIYHSPQVYLDEYDAQMSGCLLIDIRMPEMSGLELQRRLMAKHNAIPIIFMTGHGDINMAVEAMKQGSVDFVTKPFNDQVLLEIIQKAMNMPNKHFAKENMAIYMKRMALLTKREKEVLSGILEGKRNKVIAYDLGISIKTVELHRRNVMKKMQVKSIAELAKIYGLLDSSANLST